MKTKSILRTCLAVLTTAAPMAAQQGPGTVLWIYDAPAVIESSPALASDGTVYFGARYNVYAITNGGSNKWTFATQGYQDGSPAIGPDGTIYYTSMASGANSSGYLYAITSEGLLNWSYLTGGGGGSPAISRNGTIYADGDPFLHAVSVAGSRVWSFILHNRAASYHASPTLDGQENIYIASIDDRAFYAVNQNGAQRWCVSTGWGVPGDSAAIGADGTIYFAAGPLFAFTPAGTNLWRSQTNNFSGSSPVIASDGTIYLGTSLGSLCAFTPSGEFKWQVVTNGFAPPTSPAIDSKGMIYYLAHARLYVITPGGTVAWIMSLLREPDYPYEVSRTSPAIGQDGTIYITSANRLYAIAGTNKLADSPWPMYRQNARHTGKVEKPALKQPQKRADANFEFQLYSLLGQTNTVESTVDLSNWTALTSLVVTSVPMDVVDLNASNYPARFYRASAPP